jgi:hypothetical protein
MWFEMFQNEIEIIKSLYKILSIIGGQHSCGLAYFENGEVKVVLEEERLTRVKPYVDLHNNFFRYPLSSINELINTYGVDINSIDYFTSFLDYTPVKNMLHGICSYDLPEDKFINVSHVIPDAYSGYGVRGVKINENDKKHTPVGTTRKDFKANCLTKSSRTRFVSMYDGNHRSLSIEECERLQGVDEGYTDVIGVTRKDRYDMLGNGWTIPVIQHILSFIPEFKKKKEYSR